MRLMGASAMAAAPLVDELREAAFNGRPCLVWCDGFDVTALVGDDGDDSADLVRMVRRAMPELVAA